MRKYAVPILLAVFVLIWFLIPFKTLAQEDKTPYQVAYKEYLNQIGVYQVAHQDYVLRRSQYQSFRTLQAQQDAQAATVKMLQERDFVVITYLKALRERVTESPGIDSVLKADLFARIDTETAWFTDHKANIPTAGTLEDLEKDSKDASEEFTAAQVVFYKSIASVSDGKFLDLSARFDDKFSELKEKLGVIRGETREEYTFSAEKLQRLDRWVFDAESRIGRAEAKEVEAKNLILAIGTSNKATKNLPDAYAVILRNLTEGQQYMKEAGGFLQEIIRDIKTSED